MSNVLKGGVRERFLPSIFVRDRIFVTTKPPRKPMPVFFALGIFFFKIQVRKYSLKKIREYIRGNLEIAP